jgi:hypothetical protein
MYFFKNTLYYNIMKTYRFLLLLLLIIGIILITTSLTKESCGRNKGKIIYRYIPKTFEDDQNEPVYVTDIFKTLFSSPGVWEQGMTTNNQQRDIKDTINQYFLSQM